MPDKTEIREMFDEISPRYDFLNHFLSLGVDYRWRKKVVRSLATFRPQHILDVATGTGDMAFALTKLKPEKITGIDIAGNMLELAREKAKSRGYKPVIDFFSGEAENIPFPDHSFDAVTVAFGVRNYADLQKGISEMKRVLRPGGKMVILEFSHPTKFPFKQLYIFYSRFIIPVIGKFFSGSEHAYRYLPESVASFPSGEDFLKILREKGLQNCRQQRLTFGIASLYAGEKE